MATMPANSSGRARVQRHRDELRKHGLRPIQIWVPDVESKALRDEALVQSRAVAISDQATQDQDFISAISTLDD